MGKSDCATKVFLSDRRIFADLVNYRIFGGKQVVEASDLQETSCDEVTPLPDGIGSPSYKESLRDMVMNVAMRTPDGTKYLVIGVENQMSSHLAMPARCMLYDAMRHTENLRRIINDNKEKHLAGREFLSGLCPEDRIPPVVTLVVYWGPGCWTGPRFLHEMVDYPDEQLKTLCADYQLNLIEPAMMDEAAFHDFRTDLGAVLHYAKAQADGGELRRLLCEDERCKMLSRNAAEVVQTVLGMEIPIGENEEVTDMCKALEQIKQWSFEEGEQTGFAKGEQTGFAKGEQTGIQKAVSILKELQLDMGVIQEKLMTAYSLTADEALKYIHN